jgi:hypothetical protein
VCVYAWMCVGVCAFGEVFGVRRGVEEHRLVQWLSQHIPSCGNSKEDGENHTE